MTRLLASFGLVAVILLAFSSCGSEAPCSESGTCAVPSMHDAGINTDGITPPGCDVNADAKDARKCVVNDYGVFVDGTGGNDANPGTKEAPKKTIGGALTALAGKPRLYVCGAGPYAESVKLTSPVSLYGGFACGTWTHDGTKAKVAPEEAGYALHIDGVSSAVVVSDLEVVAKDGVGAGASSIAVFVSRASKVTLRRVTASAGNAQEGTDGTAPAAFTPANAPDGTGGAAGGGQTANPQCPTSIGGAGGKDGALNGATGKVAVAPEFPTGNTGAGGTGGVTCNAGGGGTDGSYSVAGAPGAGAPTTGTLDATGWKGSVGTPGGVGGNGQGGGGGAQRNPGGVGGSGGPGGCGGSGGAKGTAGGSSIAVLAFESTVLLEQSSLVPKDARRGGNGAKGQKAQLGALNAGVPNSGANACNGGVGGGAGGLSAGIVYKGTPPSIDGVSTPSADTVAGITLGAKSTAGSKGPGGDAAQTTAPASRAGQEGTAGAEGAAKAVMSAP